MTDTDATGTQTIGFRTLADEVTRDELAIEGRLPDWLTGELVRVTPAGLDANGHSVRHWFDGLAMLHKFSFWDGRVSYANRSLDTEARRRAADPNARQAQGFATDPCRGLFKRVMTMVSKVPSDNTNVNLVRLGREYLAMTETPMPVQFDPETLATLGLGEAAPGQVTTAHPHVDPDERELINYATHFGRSSSYRVYTRRAGQPYQVLGQIPVAEPSYMHSFGMTQSHVVLAEFPLVANPLELAMGRHSFIESFHWKPDRGTRFTLVDRATGAPRAQIEAEPFFAFHHVNAFETDGEVVVDLCAYPDPGIIDALFLARLRAGRPVPRPQLRRYHLPLEGGAVRVEPLAGEPFELPRLSYARANARPYRYTYGVGVQSETSAWLDQLVKADVETGRAEVWREPGQYPGEPVFVAAPDAAGEDTGVLLSVVLDGDRGVSFLLVLDATTFTELARAQAPHAVPFGFHGQYFG